MTPGHVVAGRWRIESFVGAGAMGSVHRALDLATRRPVAIKTLTRLDPTSRARFEHEAGVLAELDHPGIVAYIHHGCTDDGLAYLVMEWLEGYDLSRRLSQGALPPDDAVALAREVARALAFAHARGVVHRDVKPQNLIVVDGDVRRVKLVDFGIARIADGIRMTQTGMGMGTPGYAAPEQARGEQQLAPSADVFALGCVLFECLVGRPPFVAEHIVALLARILFDDPPLLRDVWPEAPADLEALLATMLDKDPTRRPPDGAALVRDLTAISMSLEAAPPAIRSARELTRHELRFAGVVVVGGLDDPAVAETASLGAQGGVDPAAGAHDLVRALGREHGARVEVLRGGAAVLVFGGQGSAKDGAAQGARCALAIRSLVPAVRLAVATEHAPVDGASLGRVLDRAAALLEAEPVSLPASLRGRATTSAPILVDAIAAGLLDVGFLVAGRFAPFVLLAERPVEEHRTLLGRRTSCVGREAELRSLEAMVDACIDGPVARAVLVTGAAGAGKSRLRVELVPRLRDRDAWVQTWVACAEPASRAVPFGLAAQVLWRLAGIAAADDPDLRRRKLWAVLTRDMPREDVARGGEFLGELVGAAHGPRSVALRTARAEPTVMSDQIQRAWEDFARAAADRQPILLLLEDLHWADASSLRLVEGMLCNLAESPIAAVATARPGGLEALPSSWIAGGIQTMPLPGLGKKAVRELCREALGDRGPEVAEEVARLAAGNALHVEELIRARAGGSTAPPRTVVAMLESRFDALQPGARLVLRAASILGERFDAGGIRALVGEGMLAHEVESRLEELCAAEIVEVVGTGPPGGHTHAFRHALVQEAAYGTLTDGDRTLGHRLAASWLVRMGQASAARIADHFERGGEPERAVEWYVRGAERSLEAHELQSAIRCAERGVACGAAGEVLGVLLAIQAEAMEWHGGAEEGAKLARRAMDLLPHGGTWWCRAIAPLLAGVLASGEEPPPDLVVQLLALPMLGSRGCEASAGDPDQLLVVARTAAYLVLSQRPDFVAPLLARLRELSSSASASHPQAAGWSACALSIEAAIDGDTERALELSETSESMFQRAGDLRRAGMAQVNIGCFLLQLGAWDEAARVSEDLLGTATRLGWGALVPAARANLGLARMQLGAIAEAAPLLEASTDGFLAADDRRMAGTTLCYRTWLAERRGEVDDAVRVARRAVEVLCDSRPRCLGLATLARALLGAPASDATDAEAFARAEEARIAMLALGGSDEGESFIRLTHVEAVERVQGRDAAISHLREARSRLEERAARLTSPKRRATFLEGVPENARTMELAAAWLGAPTRTPA